MLGTINILYNHISFDSLKISALFLICHFSDAETKTHLGKVPGCPSTKNGKASVSPRCSDP